MANIGKVPSLLTRLLEKKIYKALKIKKIYNKPSGGQIHGKNIMLKEIRLYNFVKIGFTAF